MERHEKRILKPETSGSKFFNDESAVAFDRIDSGGVNLTFKGFLNQLSQTTKLVSNAMDLNRDHTKNLQALQRTQKFFSKLFKFMEYKEIEKVAFEYINGKLVKKFLERIKQKHVGTCVPADETTDIEISDDENPYVPSGMRDRLEPTCQELKDFHECVFDILKASINILHKFGSYI